MSSLISTSTLRKSNGVEWKGLAVEDRSDEARNSHDLAAVACLTKVQPPLVGVCSRRLRFLRTLGPLPFLVPKASDVHRGFCGLSCP